MAIIFYSRGIFANAGLTRTNASYAVVGLTAAGLLASAVDVVLLHRVGRRKLLLSTTSGMIVVYVLLTVTLTHPDQWWAVVTSCTCIIVFHVLFCIGLGPLPAIVVAEMFAQEHRASAMSASTVFNWVFRIVVGMSFESFQQRVGAFAFVPFAVLMVGFVVFSGVFVPETKDRKVEEVSREMADGCYCRKRKRLPPAGDSEVMMKDLDRDTVPRKK